MGIMNINSKGGSAVPKQNYTSTNTNPKKRHNNQETSERRGPRAKAETSTETVSPSPPHGPYTETSQ